MKTDDNLFVRRARSVGLCRLATLLLAALFALVACGPGVVGTGTGSAPVPTASADVCAVSSLGTTLDCAATGGAPEGGTEPVVWSDADAQGANASARANVSGNNIVLVVPCRGLRFEGTWSVLSDGSTAFAGAYVDAASSLARVSILRVSAASSGASSSLVQAQLIDDAATTVGTWTLARTQGTPTFAACATAARGFHRRNEALKRG
jgi:hypothetical protein